MVHLFKDEDAIKALRNCKKSLAGNGKLLIYDPIVPSEFGSKSTNPVTPLADSALLIFAGGVDRTEGQWTSRLARAGFLNVDFINLQPQQWLIEAS